MVDAEGGRLDACGDEALRPGVEAQAERSQVQRRKRHDIKREEEAEEAE